MPRNFLNEETQDLSTYPITSSSPVPGAGVIRYNGLALQLSNDGSPFENILTSSGGGSSSEFSQIKTDTISELTLDNGVSINDAILNGPVISGTTNSTTGALKYSSNKLQYHNGTGFENLADEDFVNAKFGNLENPTGWLRTSNRPILTYNTDTRVVTVNNTAGTAYVIDGVQYDKSTTDTITVPDQTGIQFIIYNTSGNLQTSTDIPETFYDSCYIAAVYVSESKIQALYNEFHSSGMSAATHVYLHRTRGTQYTGDGGSITSLDMTAASFTVAPYTIYDEDNTLTSTASSGPTIRMFYLNQTTGNPRYWKVESNTNKAFLVGPNGRILYNTIVADLWTTAEADPNDYVLLHVFLTGTNRNTGNNDIEAMTVMGQASYANRNTARDDAGSEINSIVGGDDIAITEFVACATFIVKAGSPNVFETTEEGGNYINWLGSNVGPGTTPSSHSLLTNLDADDHLQYLKLGGRTGTQAITGDVSVSGTLKADTITEQTADNGVDIESVNIKDGTITGSALIRGTTESPVVKFTRNYPGYTGEMLVGQIDMENSTFSDGSGPMLSYSRTDSNDPTITTAIGYAGFRKNSSIGEFFLRASKNTANTDGSSTNVPVIATISNAMTSLPNIRLNGWSGDVSDGGIQYSSNKLSYYDTNAWNNLATEAYVDSANSFDALKVDSIDEKTLNTGVTIEGALLKDSAISGLTSINSVTSTELSQLETLGTTTVSADNWTQLGNLNQNVGTTGSPSFTSISIDTINEKTSGVGVELNNAKVGTSGHTAVGGIQTALSKLQFHNGTEFKDLAFVSDVDASTSELEDFVRDYSNLKNGWVDATSVPAISDSWDNINNTTTFTADNSAGTSYYIDGTVYNLSSIDTITLDSLTATSNGDVVFIYYDEDQTLKSSINVDPTKGGGACSVAVYIGKTSGNSIYYYPRILLAETSEEINNRETLYVSGGQLQNFNLANTTFDVTPYTFKVGNTDFVRSSTLSLNNSVPIGLLRRKDESNWQISVNSEPYEDGADTGVPHYIVWNAELSRFDITPISTNTYCLSHIVLSQFEYLSGTLMPQVIVGNTQYTSIADATNGAVTEIEYFKPHFDHIFPNGNEYILSATIILTHDGTSASIVNTSSGESHINWLNDPTYNTKEGTVKANLVTEFTTGNGVTVEDLNIAGSAITNSSGVINVGNFEFDSNNSWIDAVNAVQIRNLRVSPVGVDSAGGFRYASNHKMMEYYNDVESDWRAVSPKVGTYTATNTTGTLSVAENTNYTSLSNDYSVAIDGNNLKLSNTGSNWVKRPIVTMTIMSSSGTRRVGTFEYQYNAGPPKSITILGFKLNVTTGNYDTATMLELLAPADGNTSIVHIQIID